MDEADKLVYEQPFKLRAYLNVCAAICLTATVPKSKQVTLEQRVLAQLCMRPLTFWPKDLMQPDHSQQVEVLNVSSDEEMSSFLLDKLQQMAVLLYTSTFTLIGFRGWRLDISVHRTRVEVVYLADKMLILK